MRGALVLLLLLAGGCGREEVRRTSYAGGRPWSEIRYRDGKPSGAWKTWYENGQAASEGSYLEGLQHGSWKEWGEDGTVLVECRYERGVVVTDPEKRRAALEAAEGR